MWAGDAWGWLPCFTLFPGMRESIARPFRASRLFRCSVIPAKAGIHRPANLTPANPVPGNPTPGANPAAGNPTPGANPAAGNPTAANPPPANPTRPTRPRQSPAHPGYPVAPRHSLESGNPMPGHTRLRSSNRGQSRPWNPTADNPAPGNLTRGQSCARPSLAHLGHPVAHRHSRESGNPSPPGHTAHPGDSVAHHHSRGSGNPSPGQSRARPSCASRSFRSAPSFP